MKGIYKGSKEIIMRIITLLFLTALTIAAPANSCPTCVGRITQDSKPFFSDEFYTTHKSMDHLYQAINENNEKKEATASTQQVATNTPSLNAVPNDKESQ